MKTEKYGNHIIYYHKDHYIKDGLSTFVKDKGFEDFSPEGITSYLTFRHSIGDLTMFSGYGKLDFGHLVDKSGERSFWFPEFTPCLDSFEEAAYKVDSLLKRSIEQLIRDKKKIDVSFAELLLLHKTSHFLWETPPQKVQSFSVMMLRGMSIMLPFKVSI